MEKVTGNNIKSLLTGLLLVAGLLLTGCSDTFFTKPVLLCSDRNSPCRKPDDLFEGYDAYYICDEMFVEASYSKLYGTAHNKVIYNKRIKILTEKGTEYGNVTIPVLTYYPKEFEVTLTDSVGKVIPFDVELLKIDYLRSGKIIVPRVEVGCEIAIYIEFSAWFILPYYEFSFARDIPSAITSFTFSEFTPLEYEFKTYNLSVTPETKTVQATGGIDSYRYHIYKMKNVFPLPDLPYQPFADKIEPRVSVVLRSAFDRSIITNWYELSTNFEKTYFQQCRIHENPAVTALAESIENAAGSDLAAADSALRLVQMFTISEDGEAQRCNPDDILSSRRGTVWEIIALLRMLYEKMGLQTDVVVTRAQDYGGFDVDYVNPLSLKIPLLIVTVDETEYVSFPFKHGGRLGEYPAHLQTLNGLSLKNKKTVSLPKSTTGCSRSSLRFYLTPEEDTTEQRALFSLYGNIAYETRVALKNIEVKKRDEFFQQWLSTLGTSNALRSCSIEGIENPGEPLRVNLTFSNMDQIISRGRFTQINFSNLFERYLNAYDTSRVENVVIHQPFIDTVEIHLTADGNRIKPFFECASTENELFTVDCDQHGNNDTLVFRRIVQVNATTIDRKGMRKIYPQLRALNEIRESGAIIRRSGRKRSK